MSNFKQIFKRDVALHLRVFSVTAEEPWEGKGRRTQKEVWVFLSGRHNVCKPDTNTLHQFLSFTNKTWAEVCLKKLAILVNRYLSISSMSRQDADIPEQRNKSCSRFKVLPVLPVPVLPPVKSVLFDVNVSPERQRQTPWDPTFLNRVSAGDNQRVKNAI